VTVRTTPTCATAAIALVLVHAACEPSSITDARNQLGRSAADTVRYLLPLARDTFDVSDLELTGDTVIGDLLAVSLASETVRFPVADDLRIDNAVVASLLVSFPPEAFQVPGGTPLDTVVSYAGLVDEPRLQGIDSLRTRSGTLRVATSNRLVESVASTVTLNGLRDAAGVTLSGSGVLPPAPGDGSYVTDVLTFDLAGVTIVPASADFSLDLSMVVSGSALNEPNAANAVLQQGVADFAVEWLSGPLDPQVTPELSQAVEGHAEIPPSSVDALGKFKDVIRDVTIETAVGALRFQNGAAAPVELTGFELGVVELTPAGTVPRDPVTGAPIYETDEFGNPLVVPVPGPGQSLVIGRSAEATVSVAMAPLVDRMVHLLLDGHRAAVVGGGTAAAGDGQPSYLRWDDSVAVEVDVVVGLDVTVPPAGVAYPPQNEVNEGLDLKPEDVADVLDNLLVQATASAEVHNATPYELEVVIAYVEGDFGQTDVTTLPGVVVLPAVRVAAPAVSADGRVVTPVVDTVEVAVSPSDVEPLLKAAYTTTVKVRLFAGDGGNGRAALGVDDRAIVKATVVADVKRGGAQ
jgi:hypothetical protein